MDIRFNLEAGIPEDGTGADMHGKPVGSQDSNKIFPSSTEGGHDMQGRESGGGGGESLVANDHLIEVRSKIQRWYLEAKGH